MMIRDFDLPLNRKLKQFSRGMQMKAALASSLAFHPKLIVLDEPFSGLDPLVRDELAKTLLQQTREATIFVSSHDLAEVEGIATHVTFLEAGTAQLSEDLSLLRSRFREVELTLSASPDVASALPKNWLQFSLANLVVKFVDCAYHPEATAAEIQKRFSTVQAAKYSEMSLRGIFLSLAKAGKNNRGNAS
jgi:ABC-2 type transport system ATP-binding protein